MLTMHLSKATAAMALVLLMLLWLTETSDRLQTAAGGINIKKRPLLRDHAVLDQIHTLKDGIRNTECAEL